ncbi:MAG: hypothetical protein J1G07_03360 [Clostridiales bacterium]|nr:hypothetical protein [Clostridiales bacterium]
METNVKNSKVKLVIGTIILLLSVVWIAVAVYCFNYTEIVNGKEYDWSENGVACIVISVLHMIFAHFLVWSYLKTTSKRGVFSIIVYILTFVQFWVVVGVIYLGYKLFTGIRDGKFDDPTIKTVKAKDDDGKEHTLTQEYSGSSSYKDEKGNCWTTHDNGKTFDKD